MASGTNAAAIVTIAEQQDGRPRVMRILWSYSATPVGGGITVKVGSDLRCDFDITAAGVGVVNVVIPAAHDTATISLAAGGAGIAGKLYVEYAGFL